MSIGERFSKLVVLDKFRKKTSLFFLCRCDCGTEKVVRADHVRSGATKSCGCGQFGRANLTHGKSKTTEYRTWVAMKKRCLNPNDPAFPRYGGRGISICQSWNDSFENFLDDMGEKPSSNHSLDRINVDGNYEPGNCRWVTPEIQANNKRNNFRVCYRGSEMTVSNAARLAGVVPPSLAAARMRLGWPVDEALETPRGWFTGAL